VRVVFFGTPEFAVPSLRALVGEGFDVAAVVTQPDKPQGRSRSEVIPPPIKQVAEREGIPVLQPDRPTGTEFLSQLKTLNPELGVVVAYGHILKPEVLALPSRGMVNVHPSLLPELRGAAPIPWAILRGYVTTGVTIMRMTPAMDAGPILLQLPTPLPDDETGGELSLRLAEMGAEALVEALAMLETGGLEPKAQDDSKATHAPKIDREVARIVWTEPAGQESRRIRALDPKPGAWTTFGGAEFKLFGARTVSGTHGTRPGEITQVGDRLTVASGDGAIEIEEVQPAGKARMAVADWLRGAGRGVKPGSRFE
jgi:methionyl-tRNA formyltransferase